ncbi:hypothetical protein GCM10022229_04480 [Luteimonas lutimaris]|uniref:Uncharacterized protein n=1 Tax=Luteimonas lutimaris TaxID=698645 RepID=A0ABP7M590_9GAMM
MGDSRARIAADGMLAADPLRSMTMSQQTPQPDPDQPDVPGQVPNPVRDPMPGRPEDPMIPPVHDPNTPGEPDRPEPQPDPRP